MLAHPIYSNASDDAKEHIPTITADAFMAARSALRLGKPDSLARTHLLILRFTYDNKPTLLRQRFTFYKAIVRSFDEHHLKVSPQSLHPTIRRIMADTNAIPRSFGPPASRAGTETDCILRSAFDALPVRGDCSANSAFLRCSSARFP